MGYSEQFLNQVRDASDIVDVIGASIPLKRNGANWVALCPFHKEKSPSFNVSSQKQIFHCFGCHKGGDVFRFICEYENVTFRESVVRLAERAKIPLESIAGAPEQEQRGIKEQLYKLHEAIAQRWQRCLANEAGGQVARDYLARRGLGQEAIQQFRLGASPDAWDDTVNWAVAQGYAPQLVEQAGLVVQKEDTGRRYDRFRGRLMFPICDEQGRVIAFSGRVLQGDEKVAKYVNSPETPIFTKGKVLFALDKAKRAILDEGRVVVCEGQIDTIACHMAGVRNVVAPQGTALTAAHARILKRYVDEVVLCFDGDRAGQDAAIRSLDDLLASGMAIRVASIPPPEDPDSFIRQKGPEAFRAIIGSARGFFDFYLDRLLSTNDLKTDRGRMTVVREMAVAVKKTGSEVLLDTYAQKAGQRLGVSLDAVRAEFRKPSPRRLAEREASPEYEVETQAPVGGEPVPSLEMWLLRYVFLSEDLAQYAAAHLEPHWITHDEVRRIVGRYFASPGTVAELLSAFEEDSPALRIVTETAAEGAKIPDPGRQLVDVLLRLRNQAMDREIASLTARVADPALGQEEQHAALQRQRELRLAKKEPLKPLDSPEG